MSTPTAAPLRSRALRASARAAPALALLLALGCRAAPTASEGPVAAEATRDRRAPRASLPAPEAAPPTPAAEDPAAIPLAVLAGETITLGDAMGTFTSSHAGHDLLVQGEPALRELLGRVVEERLFVAEAAALGIPGEPFVVAGVERVRHAEAAALFWRRAVDERAAVTDEEVEAFYATTDMALWLTLIEVADRARAEELRAGVAAGALDMEEAAQAESIHPSATFGGLFDDVRRGQLEGALEAAVFALEDPGALTPVVPTAEGFAFARLERRVVNEDRPAREVMFPQIRTVLLGRAKEALRSEVEEDLLKRYDGRVHEELLTRDLVLEDLDEGRVVAASAGLELTLAGLKESIRLDALRAASEEDARKALRELARDWAVERAVDQEVVETGLIRAPEVAEAAAAFERELVLNALYTDYVFAGIDPSEAAVRAFYEENVDTQFTRPPEVRVAYVVVGTREEAERARARADAGEDFASIAREHSIDTASAVHGGRIGWVRPGQILQPVEDAVFALEVGGFAGPIETEQGFFVVHAMDRRDAMVVPFDEARRTARRRLIKDLQRDAYGVWISRLEERADYWIDPDGLARAVAWLDARAQERAAEKEAERAATQAGHGAAADPAAPDGIGPPASDEPSAPDESPAGIGGEAGA